MPKDQRRARWPYKEFGEYLNELMVAAGIPMAKQGPNTVVFEELTGVDPGRVSRWRQGLNQPTVESLRQIAEGLAPRLRRDPLEVLRALEVKAGRRSEAEAGTVVSPPAATESDLDRMIRLIEVALEKPKLTAEERRELEIELVRLQAMKRMSEETVSSVDRVLRRYGHGAA